ncbi:MAG: Gfo/Idh/MocA family oxidoreductase, partial [Caldilineaceae bacterium]|nr:Gfo/Idh/MocA family oxidoreductase [Caldilineaceae bacterium]
MNTDGLINQVWSNKKPGVAVIGCGYWGTNYVRIFDRMPEAQLVAICDQRPERQQELKTEYPNVAVLGDLTETIQMSEVDVVIICTGATTHYA